jgi:hypothetical protein
MGTFLVLATVASSAFLAGQYLEKESNTQREYLPF